MRELPSLQPPTLPSKRYILERLGHLELDPKSILPGGGSRRHLSNEPRDESVETKWEHLQYYESRLEDPHLSLEAPMGSENSYSSMASCSTGSSTSSANSNTSSVSSRLSARSVKEGWKKFKSNIFSRGSRGGSGNSALGTDMSGAQSCNDFEGVSTAPMPPNGNRSGALSRIRSSKSMQNLEAITSSVTSNLKEKYHSRLELRHSRPATHYEELWDDDDPDERMQRMMASVGLG